MTKLRADPAFAFAVWGFAFAFVSPPSAPFAAFGSSPPSATFAGSNTHSLPPPARSTTSPSLAHDASPSPARNTPRRSFTGGADANRAASSFGSRDTKAPSSPSFFPLFSVNTMAGPWYPASCGCSSERVAYAVRSRVTAATSAPAASAMPRTSAAAAATAKCVSLCAPSSEPAEEPAPPKPASSAEASRNARTTDAEGHGRRSVLAWSTAYSSRSERAPSAAAVAPETRSCTNRKVLSSCASAPSRPFLSPNSHSASLRVSSRAGAIIPDASGSMNDPFEHTESSDAAARGFTSTVPDVSVPGTASRSVCSASSAIASAAPSASATAISTRRSPIGSPAASPASREAARLKSLARNRSRTPNARSSGRACTSLSSFGTRNRYGSNDSARAEAEASANTATSADAANPAPVHTQGAPARIVAAASISSRDARARMAYAAGSDAFSASATRLEEPSFGSSFASAAANDATPAAG